MKSKILKLILILIGIFVIYFLRTNFSEHNLKKTISACILAQIKKDKTMTKEFAKNYCEKEIKKKQIEIL